MRVAAYVRVRDGVIVGVFVVVSVAVCVDVFVFVAVVVAVGMVVDVCLSVAVDAASAMLVVVGAVVSVAVGAGAQAISATRKNRFKKIKGFIILLRAIISNRGGKMIRTIPERIISVSDAPNRLFEIMQTIEGEQIWLVAQDGTPHLAIVDVHFLEQLLRRAWFDDLTAKTHTAFNEYLQREGYDASSMTEEQVETILQK